MHSLNIVIDVRPLLSPALTGVGHYVRSMLLALQSLRPPGVHFHLFLSGNVTAPALVQELSHDANFHVAHLKKPNKVVNLCMVSSLAFSIEQMLPHADYVWLPNINFYNSSSRIPYAVTVHDLTFLLQPRLYYSLKRRLWHRLIRVRRLLSNASRIIAVSENTKNDIVSFFPEFDHRIRIIYPGVTKMATPARFENGPLPERYVLYVGTLEPRKNVGAIIAAHKLVRERFPDLWLVIVGPYGWNSRALLSQIRADQGIVWLRYISEEHKHLLFSRADLFIWPSFYEGFGFPPLEALLHNKTVITSYRSSLPEVLGASALYVNPHNYKELGQVIAHTLAMEKHPTPSGDFLAERYSWRRSAQQLIDLISASYANRN